MILAGAHTRHRLEGELGEGRRALRLRRMFRMLLRLPITNSVILKVCNLQKYLESHKLAGFRMYIMGYQVNLYQKSHNI